MDENKHTAADWDVPAVLIFENGTSRVIPQSSPPPAANCSPSSRGKRGIQEKSYWWSWGNKIHQVQAAVELNEEGKRRTGGKYLSSGAEVHQLVRLGLLFFFLKQFHSSSPYPSHSLHHPCTWKSTMSQTALLSSHTATPTISSSSPHLKTSLSPNYQQVLPSSSSLSSPPQPSPKPCREVFSSPFQSQPLLEVPCSSQCIPHPSTLLAGQWNTAHVGLSPAVCTKTPCRINPSWKIPAALFRRSYLPPSQGKMLYPLHGCQRAFKKGLWGKEHVVENIEIIILENHIHPRFSRERKSSLD